MRHRLLALCSIGYLKLYIAFLSMRRAQLMRHCAFARRDRDRLTKQRNPVAVMIDGSHVGVMWLERGVNFLPSKFAFIPGKGINFTEPTSPPTRP